MRIRIIVEKYIVWFLVNFLFCLLPIAISSLLAKEFNSDVFLSYLAFNYTIIIIGVYTFEKNKEDIENRNSIIFWVAILFCFLIFAIFIMFPDQLPEFINNFIEEKIWVVSVIILLMSIVISIFLNRGSIKDEIENSFSEKRIRGTKRNYESKRKNFMEKLKKD